MASIVPLVLWYHLEGWVIQNGSKMLMRKVPRKKSIQKGNQRGLKFILRATMPKAEEKNIGMRPMAGTAMWKTTP